MNILQIISCVAFLISIGSCARFHMIFLKDDYMKFIHGNKRYLYGLIAILSFVYVNFIVNRLFDINWFWCFIISLAIAPIIGNPLTEFYATYFGFTYTKKIDIRTGEMDKKIYTYYVDALITFIIGIILFYLSR